MNDGDQPDAIAGACCLLMLLALATLWGVGFAIGQAIVRAVMA